MGRRFNVRKFNQLDWVLVQPYLDTLCREMMAVQLYIDSDEIIPNIQERGKAISKDIESYRIVIKNARNETIKRVREFHI